MEGLEILEPLITIKIVKKIRIVVRLSYAVLNSIVVDFSAH